MSRLRLTKVATPPAPATTKAELFYSSTDSKLEAIDESGNIAVLGGFAAKDYRLIRIFLITANTTYTPTTGTRAIYVECVGGGGSGGGATGSASNASMGGGGGGGGYSATFVPSATNPTLAASYVATVATATGTSGGAGITGANTSLGSVCIAIGGQGANNAAAGTTVALAFAGAGGASSSATGDLKVDGGHGQNGYRVSGTAAWGGTGGSSVLGGGGRAHVGLSGAGTNGGNYGGGGGGACALDGSTYSCGTGAAGVIRIWEFA